MPDKNDFSRIYNTFSGLIYGMALRITKDEELAKNVLTEVFICFNQQGLLNGKSSLNCGYIFRVTFSCIAEALHNIVSNKEVENRISVEKCRLIGNKILLHT